MSERTNDMRQTIDAMMAESSLSVFKLWTFWCGSGFWLCTLPLSRIFPPLFLLVLSLVALMEG